MRRKEEEKEKSMQYLEQSCEDVKGLALLELD